MTSLVRARADQADLIKASHNVFIDGASGCGKTRMGFELAMRLRADCQRLGLVAVRYARVPNYDGAVANAKDERAASHILAAKLIKHLGCSVGRRLPLVQVSPSVVLEDVVSLLAFSGLGGKTDRNASGRAALVLHFDEFQTAPTMVAAMLRAIRGVNMGIASSVAILPVLTGLVSEETRELASTGITDVVSSTFTLNYFHKQPAATSALHTPRKAQPAWSTTWQLVKNAEAAVGAKRLSKYAALQQAPPMIRYLVEDTGGWPQAAVHLGVALGLHHKPDAALPSWPLVEHSYMALLQTKYTAAHFQTTCQTTIKGLRKLTLLAMSPHTVSKCIGQIAAFCSPHLRPPSNTQQVSLAEPINGTDLKGMRKYGMVDLSPGPDGRSLVRISKPLLAIINDTCNLVPPKLLVTCREYHGETQELVQLYSLAVSFDACMMLRDNAPAVTLQNLRPGARIYGKADILQQVLAEAHTAPTFRVLQRGKPPPEVRPPTGALLTRGADGNDAWACFAPGFYYMQSKGQQTGAAVGADGGDNTKGPSDLAADLRSMKKSFSNAVAYELLTTKRVPHPDDVLVPGAHVTDKRRGSDRSELRTLPEATTYVVISRENLSQALGPIFGGIAARTQRLDKAGVELEETCAEQLGEPASKRAPSTVV